MVISRRAARSRSTPRTRSSVTTTPLPSGTVIAPTPRRGRSGTTRTPHTTTPIPRISLSPPIREKTRRPRPRYTRSSEARFRSTSRAMCSRSRRWRTPCRSARYSRTLRPACRRNPRLARLPPRRHRRPALGPRPPSRQRLRRRRVLRPEAGEPVSATSTDPAPSPAAHLVTSRVQDLLGRSQAYWGLPEEQRQALTRDMVKVARYIVGGPTGDNVPHSALLTGAPGTARALADSQPSDPAGQTAGQRFAQSGAVAAQQGSAALAGLVRDVNFPAFVSGLIDGVFNAIVTASIKQMDAYQKLVANVAKTVDEYMKDNITENAARDYLANRYPDHLQVDTSGDNPVLKAKDGADDSDLPDFSKDLGLKEPVSSLDEDTAENTLMPAARRRMAMDRQQLLATMVLMGINRLIVTDGSIEASCTFSLDTKDSVKRHNDRAIQYDMETDYSESGGGWFSPDYSYDSTAKFSVSTHQTEDSAAQVDLHAKLGGKVKVNFRSDTFPLDKIADIIQPKPAPGPAPARPAAPLPAGAPAPGR